MSVSMNVAILRGALSRPPEVRQLPSGDLLVSYEVTVPGEGERRAESVPVVWPAAPAKAAELDADAEVVVVGRVRRRFFRAGGVTQSRTEVVAERVVPAKPAATAARVVRAAIGAVDDALA
jgi:single-strand DNA-binding protein